jgi:hypothetical protein
MGNYYGLGLRALGTQPVIPPIAGIRLLRSLAIVARNLRMQRVEVSFVGFPPAEKIGRATGVSEVEVDGAILRCVIYGSFQPFLEALRGHEVISLTSISTRSSHLEGGQ